MIFASNIMFFFLMFLFKSLKSGKSTGDVERFFLGVSERDDVNLKMRYTH